MSPNSWLIFTLLFSSFIYVQSQNPLSVRNVFIQAPEKTNTNWWIPQPQMQETLGQYEERKNEGERKSHEFLLSFALQIASICDISRRNVHFQSFFEEHCLKTFQCFSHVLVGKVDIPSRHLKDSAFHFCTKSNHYTHPSISSVWNGILFFPFPFTFYLQYITTVPTFFKGVHTGYGWTITTK